MNKVKFCIFLSSCLLTFSCSKNSKYEKLEADVVEELHAKTLNNTFLFGNIDGMWVYDSLLIVLDYKQVEMIQFFNKETGTNIGGAVSRGPGAQEIVSIYNAYLNSKTGILSLYDADSKKILACKLAEWTNHDWFTIDYPNYEFRAYAIFPLDNNEYFAQHSKMRFTKARDGKVVAKMDDYPEIPELQETDKIKKRFFIGQTLTAVKPDESKIVQVSLLGSILQIIDIKETSIEPSVIKHFQKPIFDNVNDMVQITQESVIGFTNVQATDNYIYTTHIGKAGLTEKPKDIYVFDWNGNVVKKLTADCDILKFYADEPNGKIYAVTYNEDKEQILVTMDYEI